MNDFNSNGVPPATATLTRPNSEAETLFLGTFDLKVGSTNVVTFPKKLQDAMEAAGEKKLVLVPIDPEELPHWRLYTLKEFNLLVKRTKNNLEMEEESRSFAWQELVRSAIHFDLDSQGRFSLDKAFVDEKLKHVENKVIVLEAAHSCINLWTKRDFDTEMERVNTLKKTKMKNVMKSVFKL